MAEQQEDVQIGGIEGPDSMYVKLVATDGHEFIIKRKYIRQAKTICAMLSGPGAYEPDEENEVLLKYIESHLLQTVCIYLLHKAQPLPKPPFDVEPQVTLDLLHASNFLDC